MIAVLADGGDGMPGLGRVGVWLNDPSNYWGPDGLMARLREHVFYTLVIVAVAVLIALPLGLLIGHTGKGVIAVAGAANALRAVPTLGLVILLTTLMSNSIHLATPVKGFLQRGEFPYFVPVVIGLVVLAVPPILTSAYAGVQNVDPATRDAARGMGMTGWQVMTKVEFPCALPIIMSGLRSATLQVIATVAVAAYIPFLGGLGRFIVDGTQQLNDPRAGYPAMVAAGLVIAVLALVADGLLNIVQRLVVSPGLRTASRGRRVRAGRRTVVSTPDPVATT